jgi:uncharacterized protein YkwD
MLGTAGPAASADCTQVFLLLRYCNGATAPVPAPTPVTTPTTTAPIVSLPPVTLPPVTVPPVTIPPPPPAPVNSVDAARRLLDLTNAERQRAGLGALTPRDDLTAIAVAHSERMAQTGDIFHSTSFMSAAVKSLLNAGVRGENVAYNSDIDTAHARLMASAGHRANILDSRFSVAGFGVVRHGDGRWFITENFIQPLGAARTAVAPKPAPAPAPKPARAAPAPKPVAAPAPAPAPVPPTTAAPAPAPVAAPPVVVPAPAPVVLQAGVTAAKHPAETASGLTGPLVAGAVVLLGLTITACWMVPRQRAC